MWSKIPITDEYKKSDITLTLSKADSYWKSNELKQEQHNILFTNSKCLRKSGILNLIQSYSECHSVVYWIGFCRILNTVRNIILIIKRLQNALLLSIKSNKTTKHHCVYGIVMNQMLNNTISILLLPGGGVPVGGGGRWEKNSL